MLNFKDMKVDSTNSTQVETELNSINSNETTKQNIEIFTSMVKGQDVSAYGKKVDDIANYMTALAKRAVAGDTKAGNEINAIRTIMIQAPLVDKLNLFNLMGEVIQVGKNEEVRFETYELQGVKSKEQANSGSFPFATSKFRTETMTDFTTITGGTLVDYRQMATGNLNAEAVMVDQVQTDMMNQMFYHIYKALYTGIKNATSLKNFSETTGISKAALDAALLKARRFNPNGQVTIAGDYSVVSQLNAMAGFSTDATTSAMTSVRYSQRVMDEIMNTGLLSRYYKNPVVEIGNSYDFTKINAAGDFYETYLPEGLLFLLPSGVISPLKIGLRGGIETMTGEDINTRVKVQRFDIEFGTHLVKEHIPAMGLISDDTYDVGQA